MDKNRNTKTMASKSASNFQSFSICTSLYAIDGLATELTKGCTKLQLQQYYTGKLPRQSKPLHKCTSIVLDSLGIW